MNDCANVRVTLDGMIVRAEEGIALVASTAFKNTDAVWLHTGEITIAHGDDGQVGNDPIGYLLDKYETVGGGRDGMTAVYEFLRLAAFHLLDLERGEREA